MIQYPREEFTNNRHCEHSEAISLNIWYDCFVPRND